MTPNPAYICSLLLQCLLNDIHKYASSGKNAQCSTCSQKNSKNRDRRAKKLENSLKYQMHKIMF